VTRPRKQTVDFFPHMVKHGKTIFILEQKYGNDGYAAWFKILEMLGDTEGHYIDCRNQVTWEYLQAITRLRADILEEIIDLLARLEAIDQDLWKSRVIWSDNFIQNISEVYRNRKVAVPQKPHIYAQESVSEGISTLRNPSETASDGSSTRRNPQSRVEESREEESRGEERRFSAPPEPDQTESGRQPTSSSDAHPPTADASADLRAPSEQPQEIPVFRCKHFEITREYLNTLREDYPALTEEQLLLEIKKAADYATDNNGRFKRRANGQLKNPKLFLRNWLSRVVVSPTPSRGPDGPTRPTKSDHNMAVAMAWVEKKKRELFGEEICEIEISSDSPQ